MQNSGPDNGLLRAEAVPPFNSMAAPSASRRVLKAERAGSRSHIGQHDQDHQRRRFGDQLVSQRIIFSVPAGSDGARPRAPGGLIDVSM